MITRRRILGGAAALTAGAGLSACGADSGSPDGPASLRLAWWGNDTRNELTGKMVTAFQAANTDITVSPEPGEWTSYWEKLATQTAGNDAPDVIQMSINFIREYGDRGALLDLSEAGVSSENYAPGTLESGKVGDKLYGLNAGVNTPVIVANPTVFEKAGVDLPDDKTWTWESYGALAAELTGKLGEGSFGSNSFWGGNDTMFNAWLRQQDRALYTPDGLGFDADDVVGWMELMQSYQKAKAIPPPALSAEDETQPLAQQLAATGKAAMALLHSNQITALEDASGEDLVLLRSPSLAGKATERKAWFNASMLWSISARTAHPEAAGKLVNYLNNSVEAGKIALAERGLPPNLEVREAITPELSASDQKAAAFLNAVEPELGDPPEIPLVGASDLPAVLQRWCQEVAFGKKPPAEAAKGFVDEVTGNLQ